MKHALLMLPCGPSSGILRGEARDEFGLLLAEESWNRAGGSASTLTSVNVEESTR